MSTSPLPSVPSNGSARRGMGAFEKRAVAAKSPDALYAIVGSLAKAVDGVRAEIAANTAAVDALCHTVKQLLEAKA